MLTYSGWKRFCDLIGAFVLLVLLAPVLGGIAVILLMSQGRPIFFVQVRAGIGEKPFRIIKFRTMSGGVPGRAGDVERITAFGEILRRFSLDELPQLINILMGEMSFVGPRPLLMEYLSHYTESERKRHQVLPGLTGLAQVSGRNEIGWSERLALDAYYASNLTFFLDLKILVLSFPTVVSSRGVQASPAETMAKLDRK